jgi:hypothetical protein
MEQAKETSCTDNNTFYVMRHMKSLYFFVLFLFTTAKSFSQSIPIPPNYSVIDSTLGDLDKDGVEELVVAYNTKSEDNESSESIPRELIIYKKTNTKWTAWQQSRQALYGSRDGGMMGDPFGDISIQKGILNISHSGGSSWKWSHTDKYRFEGKTFRLIGYVSHNGKPCEYWQNVDFNLVTGKIIVKKEFENCATADQKIYKRQNETFLKKGIHITLENRSEKEIKIVSPKYRHEIYVAMKID